MKKITIIFCLLLMGVVHAQSVYEISWEEGISESAASIIIQRGDIVVWKFSDNTVKSVSSRSDGSESFDSGLLKGENTFSHVFNKLGTTEYQNDNNPNMFGKVTVVNTLSAEDKFVKNLSFFPNPVRTSLTISSIFKIQHYQVYNVLGTLVAEGKGAGTLTRIDMDRLNSGLYFVKVFAANSMQSTLKIAKG